MSAKKCAVKKIVGNWQMDYSVLEVLHLGRETAASILCASPYTEKNSHRSYGAPENWISREPRPLVVNIDYPLEIPCKVGVSAKGEDKDSLRIGELLWDVAKQYDRIYANPDEYGVWGHGLDQLYFEGLTINNGGYVELAVGS